MVGSPAAVGSWCRMLGWGRVRQKPFLEPGGALVAFLTTGTSKKKKMQLSLGCTDFEKLGGPLDRDLWKELDIEDECVRECQDQNS